MNLETSENLEMLFFRDFPVLKMKCEVAFTLLLCCCKAVVLGGPGASSTPIVSPQGPGQLASPCCWQVAALITGGCFGGRAVQSTNAYSWWVGGRGATLPLPAPPLGVGLGLCLHLGGHDDTPPHSRQEGAVSSIFVGGVLDHSKGQVI